MTSNTPRPLEKVISNNSDTSPRRRIRELFPSLHLGRWAPGPKNCLTDVPHVLVSTQTIRQPPNLPSHDAINTGVTTILPSADWFTNSSHAGIFRFNGSGEMTGSHWIDETGLLSSPIIITSSFAVGQCYSGIYKHAIREHSDPATGLVDWFLLPVVAETYDGFCSDIAHTPITSDHVVRGIDNATDAKVEEGCTGGGTGMMCCGFKAGTGSASRVIPSLYLEKDGDSHTELTNTTYTVAALVQSNFGAMRNFMIGGAPVGRLMAEEAEKAATTAEATSKLTEGENRNKDGSIIVVLATDAPLHPLQLQRLAKRATVGVAKVGGWGSNTSGDIFLAFSTANKVPREPGLSWKPRASSYIPLLEDQSINGLFEAATEAVEEAIYNSIFMAEDTIGPLGVEVKAIDVDRVSEIMQKYL